MTEEEELLAQIGELEGRINKRKHEGSHPSHPDSPNYRSRPYSGTGRQRFPNRSLVNYSSSSASPKSSSNDTNTKENSYHPLHTVTKYGRSKTWISKNTARPSNGGRGPPPAPIDPRKKDSEYEGRRKSIPNTPASNYITIDSLKFRVTSGGKELERVFDDDITTPTPHRATISGILFESLSNGNLVRAGTMVQGKPTPPLKTALCKRYTSTGTPLPTPLSLRLVDVAPSMLETFTAGQCSHGNTCYGIHDVDRIAICPSVLRGVPCPAGDACDLAHNATPHIAPTCLHFLRGNCTKGSCTYSHTSISPSAPLCQDFAHLGYCEKGAACGLRHLRECPKHSSPGGCSSKQCSLPHVDRGSTMRRQATNQKASSIAMDVDGRHADETENDKESPDDDLEPAFLAAAGNTELTEQDFVRFV